VRVWHSGNWSGGYDAWLHQRCHERSVPGLLQGQWDKEGDLGQWEDIILGHVEVVEASLDEMKPHQANAQVLQEKDEYGRAIVYAEKDFDDDSGAGRGILAPRVPVEKRNPNFKRDKNDGSADFNL